MYNYLEAMKADVWEAIKENYNVKDYEDREEMEQTLNDELWTDDNVTGNGSGSYTFDNYKAREYVIADGIEYVSDMCSEFGIEAEEIGKRFINEDWEWMDVSIRCYLLGQAISEVLDEMEEEGAFNKEEETT